MNQYLPLILILIVPYIIFFSQLIYKNIKSIMRNKQLCDDSQIDIIFYSILGFIYAYLISLLV
jgi:hypothetical protein